MKGGQLVLGEVVSSSSDTCNPPSLSTLLVNFGTAIVSSIQRAAPYYRYFVLATEMAR